MKQIKSILVLVSIALVVCSPSYALEWGKTYGNVAGRDTVFAIQQTSGGGYVLAGSTYTSAPNGEDAWILMLNADGTVAWQKSYGGEGTQWAQSIQETTLGGYIVGCTKRAVSSNEGYDPWALKLDSQGTIEWKKKYFGGGDDDYLKSIRQTPDGGFIAAAETESFGNGETDVWVLKLNPDGSVDWQNTYGGIYRNPVYSMEVTADGGYVIASGASQSGELCWILKLQADGTIEWQKQCEDDGSQALIRDIRQTQDGGYIGAGQIQHVDAVTWQEA
ncbi:MAG: hypothetical protein SWH78_01850 [Thermodesulfobacteriota bacterium]|nr:hypothetical protein [Thermodesulfobacteriota bacterium]